MRDDDAAAVLAAVGLLVALVVLFRACETRAEPRQDNCPEAVLARVVAKEAGLDGYTDLPPIATALLHVGRGNVVLGARMHSRRAFDPALTRPANRWVVYLQSDCSRPALFPSQLDWPGVHRPRCQQLISLARRFLAGTVGESPCEPVTWAAKTVPMRARAARIGYRLLDCGPTRNDFYAAPLPRRPRID